MKTTTVTGEGKPRTIVYELTETENSFIVALQALDDAKGEFYAALSNFYEYDDARERYAEALPAFDELAGELLAGLKLAQTKTN